MRELSSEAMSQVAGGWQAWYDPNEATQVDDVVVTGSRMYFSSSLGQLMYFYGSGGTPTGGYVTGGGGGSPYNSAPDGCQTQIEFNAQATTDPFTATIYDDLSNGIAAQSDRMRALPDTLEIRLPANAFAPGYYEPGMENLVLITGSELRTLWQSADFIVLGNLTPNGQHGSANWNNGNPIFSVYNQSVDDYMATPASQAWYFFHELLHTTQFGRNATEAARDLWQANPDTTRFEDSQYFAANERVINGLAADLGALFGIDVRNGYPATPYPSYPTTQANITGVSGTLTPIAGAGPGGPCGN